MYADPYVGKTAIIPVGKLEKIIKRIRSGIADMHAFGVCVGLTNMLWPIIAHCPEGIREAILKNKKRKIDDLLQKTCSETIQKYSLLQPQERESEVRNDAPIFVCWLQGIEKAPCLVKACVRSIEQHASGHPVHVITLANYKEWVSLPRVVIQRQEEQMIANAHFADVLRCALLAKYGGCWIDATIWMSGDIHAEIFERPFYSCRFPAEGRFVTDNMWSNFFIAAKPDSVTINFTKDMFYEYVEKESRFIDYFLMDYIIRWGYDNIPAIRKEIDQIPYNNQQIGALRDMLYVPCNSPEVESVLKESYIHKLSWRLDLSQLPNDSVGKFILR